MRRLWHSATPLRANRSTSTLNGRLICARRFLHWVPKTWLLALIPLAIFFSSIEMANSPTLHAVIFRIGALICAAPAGIVREILPRLPATRIPGVAEAIEGLVNVRGSLLTVLDGHVLLQQSRRDGDEGAIVVVDVAGRRYGLGVGQVIDFLEVPEHAVAERADLPGIDPRLVKAVGVRDGQHFILLDIDALVAPIIGS
jgi:purine-binding chemotaxis protein CheW